MMGITAIAHTVGTPSKASKQTYNRALYNVIDNGKTIYSGDCNGVSEKFNVTENMVYICASRGNLLQGKYQVYKI